MNINSSINRIYTKLGKLYQTRFKLPDISSHYHIIVWTKHENYIYNLMTETYFQVVWDGPELRWLR